MNLKAFKFPDLDEVDIALAVIGADPRLIKEAKDRGFYNGHTPYNQLFSMLFYKGGNVDLRDDLDPTFKSRAWRYCRALMHSFQPSHEDKEAVCAMLLSELVKL